MFAIKVKDSNGGYLKFTTPAYPVGIVSGYDSAKQFEEYWQAKDYIRDIIRNPTLQNGEVDWVMANYEVVSYTPPYHKYGQIAALDKKQLTDNPYKAGTDAAIEWEKGWKYFHA